ncbi:hypothetical protein IT6_03735 [Methylacidiphilum caldifontis]|nr:hypothetical protein IT6_03735 [Methylacidiphilum caldifontis]
MFLFLLFWFFLMKFYDNSVVPTFLLFLFVGFASLNHLLLYGQTSEVPSPQVVFEEPLAGLDPSSPPRFIPGSGLFLGAITEKEMGIQTTAAVEKEIAPLYLGESQVYRSSWEKSSRYNGQEEGFAYSTSFIDGKDSEKLNVGQRVHVKVKRAGSETLSYEGKIFYIDKELIPIIGKAEIILQISDPSHTLQVGDWINFETSLGLVASWLTIPESAILDTASGCFCYVFLGKGHYQRKPIEVAFVSQGLGAIRKGLEKGAEVVTQGAKQLWLLELSLSQSGGPSTY